MAMNEWTIDRGHFSREPLIVYQIVHDEKKWHDGGRTYCF